MAVYRRSYKAYTGRLTAAWSRCFVLFRYSRRNLFRSKFVTALFVLCFFWPLFCLLWIYLAHSASFLREMGVPGDALSIRQRLKLKEIAAKAGSAYVLDGNLREL